MNICFNYIKYNIKLNIEDLNESTYFKNLINYLEKDDKLRINIIGCLKRHFNNEEKIIKKIFKIKGIVNQDNIDFNKDITKYF